jgi:penicillin-binding protein 2
MERISRFRTGVFLVLIAAMLAVFSLRLYKLQAKSTEKVAADAESMTYATTVEAARGNILDRNGNLLVTNRASYNLVIVNFVLFNSTTPNESLLKLLELCDKLGIEYQTHFPVSKARPYTYDKDDLPDVWQGYFRSFLQNREYDPDIGAATLMNNLRAAYRIPDDWTQDQVYKVVSVRYELELRSIDGTGLENYTLASDVKATDLAAVMELGVPGVVVESGTVREYNTKYAAHVLGFIQQMDSVDYQSYKAKGYAMNAYVGKSGAELAFEDYLHGSSGLKYTTVSKTGEVLEEYYKKMPQPGDNVELTLDIGLQSVAEDALAKTIADLRDKGINTSGEGKDAEGGAVVVEKVKTGEILAMASYPTYDPSDYFKDYTALSQAEFSPLYNRALLAAYPPGSVFKMVTADAAIDYGGIGQYYQITDKGVYTYYKDKGYTCNCYLYTSHGTTHGTINMQQALQVSCNYYFYEAGRVTYYSYYKKTGINAIDLVAKTLGLGESTGIELQENVGQRANAETKKKLYSGNAAKWYGADVLQASIGQSDNRFTPLQLASYTSALANGGVRYKTTLLSRVVSWDYSQLVKKNEPVVASTLDMSDQAKECISAGMYMAANNPGGTGYKFLGSYPVKVACKTGTAQHGNTDMGSDHASFVLYAPADNPEIAISVYIEKGAQGGYLANVCIPILNAYFSTSAKYETTTTEGVAH